MTQPVGRRGAALRPSGVGYRTLGAIQKLQAQSLHSHVGEIRVLPTKLEWIIKEVY